MRTINLLLVVLMIVSLYVIYDSNQKIDARKHAIANEKSAKANYVRLTRDPFFRDNVPSAFHGAIVARDRIPPDLDDYYRNQKSVALMILMAAIAIAGVWNIATGRKSSPPCDVAGDPPTTTAP